MSQWISQWDSALQLVVANALFALSTWVSMSVGLLSFASVAFGAGGGFTAAHFDAKHDLPLIELLVIGALAGALVAAVAIALLGHLKGHWFALTTVALLLITRVVVLNLESITGGSVGMPVARKIDWLELIIIAVVVYWVVWRLSKSRFGLASEAIRTDLSVAECMGINVKRLQIIAFALSGAIGGIAGVVLAQLLQYISPDTFYVTLAFAMIASVVLGGSYHWGGSIVGALIFTMLPQLLEGVLAEASDIVNGVLLLLIMIFLPRGILDPRRSVWRWFRRRRSRSEPEAAHV